MSTWEFLILFFLLLYILENLLYIFLKDKVLMEREKESVSIIK